MDPINKTALRAAVLIHEQLAGSKRQDVPLYLPEYSWNNIQQLRRQIDLARQRGWHGAARRLTEDLANTLDNCRRELENALRAIQSHSVERRVSSASDIYRDILALENEFEEVDIDLDGHELSVTTDRIVLEDLNFGAFEIRLDWRRLGSSPAYRVVALDPHPAAKSDGVTHPHVQDGHLCEGEGRAAVQAALAECRLYDFFLLISRLLHTYARGSAYVELDNWDGTPCEGCDESLSEDDRYCCNRCGSTLCASCAVPCPDCEEYYCSGCLGECAACGENYCPSCLAECPACRKRFCSDCRNDDSGLCQSCHEKQQHKEKEDDPPQNDADKQPTGRSGSRRRRSTAGIPA